LAETTVCSGSDDRQLSIQGQFCLFI